MGLFSKLFGDQEPTKVDIQPDFIFLSSAGKYKAIRHELRQKANSRTAAILLIAHFPDVETELQRVLEDYDADVPAMVVRADDLSSTIAAGFAVDDNTVIDLMVAERHPLVSEDDRVLAGFADDLPCRCRVSYYMSLDEPLMSVFAGDFVKSMLQRMGFSEDEAIGSKMVQRRIRTAQQQITKAATGNQPADSAAEWFERNVTPES